MGGHAPDTSAQDAEMAEMKKQREDENLKLQKERLSLLKRTSGRTGFGNLFSGLDDTLGG